MNTNDFNIGDKVRFGGGPLDVFKGYFGTVDKVGTKNIRIRYTKGNGSHLFQYTVDPTKVGSLVILSKAVGFGPGRGVTA